MRYVEIPTQQSAEHLRRIAQEELESDPLRQLGRATCPHNPDPVLDRPRARPTMRREQRDVLSPQHQGLTEVVDEAPRTPPHLWPVSRNEKSYAHAAPAPVGFTFPSRAELPSSASSFKPGPPRAAIGSR